MRESMARLTPQFAASRTVREYTEKHYIPAAEAFRQRSEQNGQIGKEIAAWQQALSQQWEGIKFVQTKVTTQNGQHQFSVSVYLNGVDPQAVTVQLYAEHANGDASLHLKMERMDPQTAPHTFEYKINVPANRPATDFTPRLIPFKEGVSVPLENPHILWQH